MRKQARRRYEEMGRVKEGDLLWTPSAEREKTANISRFLSWLSSKSQSSFDSYEKLWEWSVNSLEEFWQSIVEYFEVWSTPYEGKVLSSHQMPGARWFEEARLNYASLLRLPDDDPVAIVAATEGKPLEEISYSEVLRQAALFQDLLDEVGVDKKDRVAGYLPNIPETVYAFLATAAKGAVWSCCSPEFGTRAVLDRFEQIDPVVLVACSTYRYGGKIHDRKEALLHIVNSLPSLEAVVLVDNEVENGLSSVLKKGISNGAPIKFYSWKELKNEKGSRVSPNDLEVEDVAFDHPLWILYSSGTTGLPKPIVHGHGGIVLEHLKALSFHMDIKTGSRFFWYTSTGWMMWNFLVSGLLLGSTIVTYDGSPFWPDALALWKLAEEAGIECFGVSGPYIHACMKQGINPRSSCYLSRLRTVGSTGAPLSPEGFEWLYETVSEDLLVASISGGTDVCTAFVGSCPILPVHAGEIQCRMLGAKVEAFDEHGKSVIDEVGELVLTEPLPSMPLYFWNDFSMERYRDSYFSTYPGIWRHGDWIKITPRGSCVIYGRSDATLKRGGVRMGTSEFYRVVEAIDEVEDSLVIDVPRAGDAGELLLFVVLTEGSKLDEELRSKITGVIRSELSPRHVPDRIFSVGSIPKTINGKKMEVPVKKIFSGAIPEKAVSKGSMADPEALDEYIALAQRYSKQDL